MNIFADEWRDCLREQYLYVVRENDQTTLVSLTQVMLNVGFTETELREFQVMATMHVDDVAEDFVPDMDILEPTIHAGVEVTSPEEAQAELADDMPPTYEEVLEEAEATVIEEDEPEADDEPDDPAAPAQLSLF